MLGGAPMWDDLLDIATEAVRDVFSVPLTYVRLETDTTHTTTPSGEPLTAIFDVIPAESNEGVSLTVANRITVIDVRLADLGFDPAVKDRVTINGKSYDVNKRLPSSSGMMKLQLREV